MKRTPMLQVTWYTYTEAEGVDYKGKCIQLRGLGHRFHHQQYKQKFVYGLLKGSFAHAKNVYAHAISWRSNTNKETTIVFPFFFFVYYHEEAVNLNGMHVIGYSFLWHMQLATYPSSFTNSSYYSLGSDHVLTPAASTWLIYCLKMVMLCSEHNDSLKVNVKQIISAYVYSSCWMSSNILLTGNICLRPRNSARRSDNKELKYLQNRS